MIRMLEKLGDAVLTAFVPAITADAASTAACINLPCGPCFAGTCMRRYKNSCDGVNAPCNRQFRCFDAPGCNF